MVDSSMVSRIAALQNFDEYNELNWTGSFEDYLKLVDWTGKSRTQLLEQTRVQELFPKGEQIYFETHVRPLLLMVTLLFVCLFIVNFKRFLRSSRVARRIWLEEQELDHLDIGDLRVRVLLEFGHRIGIAMHVLRRPFGPRPLAVTRFQDAVKGVVVQPQLIVLLHE